MLSRRILLLSVLVLVSLVSGVSAQRCPPGCTGALICICERPDSAVSVVAPFLRDPVQSCRDGCMNAATECQNECYSNQPDSSACLLACNPPYTQCMAGCAAQEAVTVAVPACTTAYQGCVNSCYPQCMGGADSSECIASCAEACEATLNSCIAQSSASMARYMRIQKMFKGSEAGCNRKLHHSEVGVESTAKKVGDAISDCGRDAKCSVCLSACPNTGTFDDMFACTQRCLEMLVAAAPATY